MHLREPGFEWKETIATGTRAAARGGFTAVACMPNTRPVADSPEVIRRIRETAEREGAVRVLPIGAITRGERGRELTDMAALKEAGAVAVSDDGVGIQDSRVMKGCDADGRFPRLAAGGPLRRRFPGRRRFRSRRRICGPARAEGNSGEAESVHVARDILLAEATGSTITFATSATPIRSDWCARRSAADSG